MRPLLFALKQKCHQLQRIYLPEKRYQSMGAVFHLGSSDGFEQQHNGCICLQTMAYGSLYFVSWVYGLLLAPFNPVEFFYYCKSTIPVFRSFGHEKSTFCRCVYSFWGSSSKWFSFELVGTSYLRTYTKTCDYFGPASRSCNHPIIWKHEAQKFNFREGEGKVPVPTGWRLCDQL